MEKYYFFNSKDGDRIYNADSFADAYKPLFVNGVFNGNLQVTANGDMTVTVGAGYAWIDGKTYHNTEEITLDLETASGTLDRIDGIVIRKDELQRKIYAAVVTGGNAKNPVAPELQRDTNYYDLRIAEVKVAAGVVSVTQANITDKRADASVCGWVTGAVEQIDFEQITKQFENFMELYREQVTTEYANYVTSIVNNEQQAAAELEEFKTKLSGYETEQKTEFEEWVETIKNILDEAAAGKLENEIEDLQSTVTELQQELIERTSITTEAWLGACYLGGTYLIS